MTPFFVVQLSKTNYIFSTTSLQMSVHLPDPTFITCPFDPRHRVWEYKYKLHLLHCPSEARSQFEQCRYNCYHWIPKGQMESHLRQCDDFNYAVKVLKVDRAVDQKMVSSR